MPALSITNATEDAIINGGEAGAHHMESIKNPPAGAHHMMPHGAHAPPKDDGIDDPSEEKGAEGEYEDEEGDMLTGIRSDVPQITLGRVNDQGFIIVPREFFGIMQFESCLQSLCGSFLGERIFDCDESPYLYAACEKNCRKGLELPMDFVEGIEERMKETCPKDTNIHKLFSQDPYKCATTDCNRWQGQHRDANGGMIFVEVLVQSIFFIVTIVIFWCVYPRIKKRGFPSPRIG